ncbi:MAG: hypothetical protein IJA10_10200 [Lachnospiraceae bacterium]|nr:hypothetical protein [Lachnospiraceae bacterium]
MEENKLYFIKDEYFEKYKVPNTSLNKDTDENGEHNRPCYYAFKEDNIYWMIPISSQVDKYEYEYQKSIKKYGVCDSISFVYIKGNKNAALIQNMIPVLEKYIDKIYTYHNTNTPIEINDKKRKELNAKARKVVRFARIGKELTFTPILDFEKRLIEELNKEE